MKITITGRKIELTQALKDIIEKKFSRLDRYFKEDTEAKVTLSVERNVHQVEATIYSHSMIYRVAERTNDMYVTLDKTIDAFERQFRKHKTRLEKRMKSEAFTMEVPASIQVEEEKEFNIVRKKVFTQKPMSPEEAILQMNLLGHEFFIFSNSDDMAPTLVYKRKDGDYGLIEIK